MTAARLYLEVFAALGVAKAGNLLALGIALDSDSQRGFGFGAGLAQQHESGQCFAVNLGNQEVFAASFLLPDLPDLNFVHRHNRHERI
jgi:hypothetical protein